MKPPAKETRKFIRTVFHVKEWSFSIEETPVCFDLVN